MTTLVTGGTGTLGRLLVPRLETSGQPVIITSRKDRPGSRQLDLAKGTGLDAAVSGIDTIVHAATDPARSRKVDVEGTRALLEAAKAAGVGHVLYLSIVGIDDHPFPYYRSKKLAEEVVAASGVPWTILRTTQFHEFLDRIFNTGPVITVFRGIEFQVIDGGVVADRLAELVSLGPSGRADDMGGPRAEPMRDMATSWKKATSCREPIVTIPVVGKSAAAFKARKHHTPNARRDTPTWQQWLDRTMTTD